MVFEMVIETTTGNDMWIYIYIIDAALGALPSIAAHAPAFHSFNLFHSRDRTVLIYNSKLSYFLDRFSICGSKNNDWDWERDLATGYPYHIYCCGRWGFL